MFRYTNNNFFPDSFWSWLYLFYCAKVAATPLSDDTGYDLYAEDPVSYCHWKSLDPLDESRAEQEIVGFFVAPFTGTYNFYLAADDEATCEF